MEAKFEVETRRGPVWLWGRDTGRPLLLVLTGTLNPADYLDRAQHLHPEVDVLRGHMPGNHCPELDEHSMRAIVEAYDAALGHWAHRPAVVLGVSIGGVAALGLRHAAIRARVAVEPPLRAADLGPMLARYSNAPETSRAFLRGVLGVGPDGLEPVDHTWILDGLTGPAHIIVGSQAPRLDGLPSLVGPGVRQLLAARPEVNLAHAQGAGHNVPRDAGQVMHALVKVALNSVASGA